MVTVSDLRLHILPSAVDLGNGGRDSARVCVILSGDDQVVHIRYGGQICRLRLASSIWAKTTHRRPIVSQTNVSAPENKAIVINLPVA